MWYLGLWAGGVMADGHAGDVGTKARSGGQEAGEGGREEAHRLATAGQCAHALLLGLLY